MKIYMLLAVLVMGGCLSNPEAPEENLTPEQNDVKEFVLNFLQHSIYKADYNVPVVTRTKEELEALAGKPVAGLSTWQAVYIIDGFTLNGFCMQLVHEYMHRYLLEVDGDADVMHTHKYEFFTLPYNVCKGII